MPAQVERIVNGANTIELMNPLGLVFARGRNPAIEALAVAQRIVDGVVGTTYFAQLYTHVASGLTTLRDAAGKSVGYGVPYSTSNFLIPALELEKAGLHPIFAFASIGFFGGHDKVAEAVYRQQVALGAGHDGVIVDLSKRPGFEDAATKLKTLLRSPPIPSDPVAARIADADLRQAVAQALVAAGATTEGKAAIALFWGKAQGLAPTTAASYQVIADAVEQLRLRPEDLFAAS